LAEKIQVWAMDAVWRVFTNKTSQYLGVSKKNNSWLVQGSLGTRGKSIRMRAFKSEREAAEYFDHEVRTQAINATTRR
jgi:hypothetical protein